MMVICLAWTPLTERLETPGPALPSETQVSHDANAGASQAEGCRGGRGGPGDNKRRAGTDSGNFLVSSNGITDACTRA